MNFISFLLLLLACTSDSNTKCFFGLQIGTAKKKKMPKKKKNNHLSLTRNPWWGTCQAEIKYAAIHVCLAGTGPPQTLFWESCISLESSMNTENSHSILPLVRITLLGFNKMPLICHRIITSISSTGSHTVEREAAWWGAIKTYCWRSPAEEVDRCKQFLDHQTEFLKGKIWILDKHIHELKSQVKLLTLWGSSLILK